MGLAASCAPPATCCATRHLFLVRAGFDVFEVKKDADVKSFVDPPVRYSVFYQAAGDERVPALRRRLGERGKIEAPSLQGAAQEFDAARTA